MSISILPAEIANQIAAGEVVERPASVVKECVENAIDAKASQIEIHIQDGGKTILNITDNGQGMSPEDMVLSIKRHATSKIKTIEDLFAVQSFGFRGEALAAISAVSDFTIISKTNEQDFGSKLEVLGGKSQPIASIAANNGTQIIVNELFKYTPARKQYLKTDETEYREILKEIRSFALANPAIGFKVFKNEKLALDFVATQNHKQRVRQCFRHKSDQLIPTNFQTPTKNNDSQEPYTEIDISGFISRPETCVGNKNQQYLFVNGRKINDYRLTYAIREAYNQSCGIEKHLHPQFVIFLNIDPILVDVNVHPRKLEVKFAEPQTVFAAITSMIGKTLLTASQSPNIDSHQPINKASHQAPIARQMVSAGNLFSQKLGQMSTSSLRQNYPQATHTNMPQDYKAKQPPIEVLTPNESLPLEAQSLGNLQLIGQIACKYITAESDQGLFIFDQHALHERQRFEYFWEKIHGQKVRTQKLLIKQSVRLTEEAVSILYENKKPLQDLGFTFHFPADDKIEITAVPDFLVEENLESYFRNFIDYFENEQIGEHAFDQFLRKIIEYKACRGAVMFGDRLEVPEMQKILADLKDTKFKWLCAHGRPNYWFIPFEELDKKFHR